MLERALQCVKLSFFSRSKVLITPLSSYFLPFQSPRKNMGLPTRQSVSMSEPKKNLRSFSLFVNAAHTLSGEALILVATRAASTVILTASQSGVELLQRCKVLAGKA